MVKKKIAQHPFSGHGFQRLGFFIFERRWPGGLRPPGHKKIGWENKAKQVASKNKANHVCKGFWAR